MRQGATPGSHRLLRPQMCLGRGQCWWTASPRAFEPADLRGCIKYQPYRSIRCQFPECGRLTFRRCWSWGRWVSRAGNGTMQRQRSFSHTRSAAAAAAALAMRLAWCMRCRPQLAAAAHRCSSQAVPVSPKVESVAAEVRAPCQAWGLRSNSAHANLLQACLNSK